MENETTNTGSSSAFNIATAAVGLVAGVLVGDYLLSPKGDSLLEKLRARLTKKPAVDIPAPAEPAAAPAAE